MLCKYIKYYIGMFLSCLIYVFIFCSSFMLINFLKNLLLVVVNHCSSICWTGSKILLLARI